MEWQSQCPQWTRRRRWSRVLCRGNAHNLAVHIEERATGVAGIDGCIGLEHIDDGPVGIDRAVLGADIAHGLGGSELTQGVANGRHLVANLQIVGIANAHSRQVLAVNFQEGHIAHRVGAHQLGGIFRSIGQGDCDGLGPVNHVVVGKHIAVGCQDEA